MQSAPIETPTPDTRYKFVVSSADEAVKVLRQRLGENARVISVRQVEGAGLSRFLRAPKLEVIAELVPPVVAAAPAAAEPNNPEPVAEPEPLPQEDSGQAEDVLSRLVRRAGIPDAVASRWKLSGDWDAASQLGIGGALALIASCLRKEFRNQPHRAVTDRVAFLGTAGTGKTTALCKRLSMDVFFHYRRAAVWKVDTEKPNPADGLTVFCGALDVPLIRAEEDLPSLDPEATLYLDVPGLAPTDVVEIKGVKSLLDRQAVATRVLVINAAYDADLIKDAYRLGERLNATHVVLTHTDELVRWGKLWEFVLAGSFEPLFLSHGQNIAGDFTEEVFDAVLAKTFPAPGKEAATNS